MIILWPHSVDIVGGTTSNCDNLKHRTFGRHDHNLKPTITLFVYNSDVAVD